MHLIAHLGRGGTERQLTLMLEHLDPARIESTVMVTSPSPNALWNERLAGAGIRVVDLSAQTNPLTRLLAMAREIEDRPIDVIHSWTLHLNAYAAIAGKLTRCATWGSVRGSLTSEGWQRLPRLYRWLCLSGVDRLLANAEALRTEVRSAGVDGARVQTLANAVELPVVPPDRVDCRKALDLAADVPVVGSVGNLRRIKNHELFIDAMAAVCGAHPTAVGVIVGQPLASEPETAVALQSRIESHGLEGRVRLVGFRDNAADLIAAFDVLALTSHSEGMPNAVLEAMAVGRPVVAVRVGGVSELVRDGQNGRLVEPGDARVLAGALMELLVDPEGADRMGREGRRLVAERHAPDRLAAQLASEYLRCVS